CRACGAPLPLQAGGDTPHSGMHRAEARFPSRCRRTDDGLRARPASASYCARNTKRGTDAVRRIHWTGGVMGPFDTPLRAVALGVLVVAVVTLSASLVLRRERWRDHVLVLVGTALGLVLLSNALQ